MGILLALGINDWNENRIAQNKERKIASRLLQQMRLDMGEVENQLDYLEDNRYLYEILTDLRKPVDFDEKLKARFEAPFLVTTSIRLLNLEPRALGLLNSKSSLETNLSSVLDTIQRTYQFNSKVLEMTEKMIVDETIGNLNYLKENYEWYYKIITKTESIDVKDFNYFEGPDYRNRVANMYLIQYLGYENAIEDFQYELEENIEFLEAVLKE